jgi:hypothetical protein
MKNPIRALIGKKPKSAGEIETELARLGQKLEDHKRRRSELMQAAEEARATWRVSLADEDDVIAATKANVDRLERDADEAARVITEYEAAITDCQDRFRRASTEERRRAAAADLEATAKKVDALKSELEKGVAQIAGTMRKIMAAIPADVGVFPMLADARPGDRPERRNEFASNREAAAAVLAEALLAELPELYDFIKVGHYTGLCLLAVGDPQAARVEAMGWTQRDAMGLPASTAVEALISSRLRDRAARIIAGELEPDGSMLEIVEPFRVPPPLPEMRIVGLRNFKFLMGEPGYKPRYEGVTDGADAYVREEVGRAAIARGYAAPHGSPEAIKRVEELRSRKSVQHGFGPSIDDHFDLGDPLGLQRAYQAANANDVPADDGVDEAMDVAGLDRHSGEFAMSSPRGS